MYENLVKTIINDHNGIIKPLIIPSTETNGTGICNSSLFVEEDKNYIYFHINNRMIKIYFM